MYYKIWLNNSFKVIGLLLIIFFLTLPLGDYVLSAPAPDKLSGGCYGPFREGQDPERRIFSSVKEISQDISFIVKLFRAIRTYGMGGTGKEIPALCQKAGLDCFPGAWLSRDKRENENEIKALIEVGKQKLSTIKALIVGNEVLLRKDMLKDELINLIKRVKRETGLRVTTADIWGIWMKNPDLAKEVDFIMVHIHPFWEGVRVDQAGERVINKINELKQAFPDKEIVIGETGWPSGGQKMGLAVPSEKNQANFISDFCALAQENQINFFIFEVFDESWKSKFEGKVGAHWGLYYSHGGIKPLLKNFVPLGVQKGIKRTK